ncbi:RND transporter [Paenibacillus sp. 32O-W]|nr:RND transporter [Paenibacillus sp. 32O-W]
MFEMKAFNQMSGSQDAAPNGRIRHSRRSLLLGGFALLLALVPAGCSLLPTEEEPIPPPLIKPAEEQYDTVKVATGTIERYFQGTATFVSRSSSQVYFTQSGGRLVKLHAKVGETVKKGQLLAELDHGDLELRTSLQRLAVEKAEIELKRSREGGDPNDIRMREIDLESAKLTLNALEEQIVRNRLTSPIDGIVTYVSDIQPGQTVNAYQAIYSIADPNQVQLTYEAQNTSDIIAVQPGMQAEITYQKEKYTGTVLQTPSSAPLSGDEAERERNARKLILQTDAKGEIGQFADFKIFLERKENVIIIPRSGLRTYLDRKYVQVIDGERRKEVDVEVGIMTSTEVEIRRGLEEGQEVILNN